MRRLLLLVSTIVFVDTVFFAAITPLLPRYSETFELSKSAAGVLAAAYPAGTFVAALPAGWLAARAGTRPTVLVGLTLTCVASVAFAFAPSVVVLDLARFLQGVGGAASWAGALAWLTSAAPADRRGELLGTAMAAAIVGALFGPVLGAAAAAAGPELVFSGVAVTCAALMGFALRVAPAPSVPSRFGDLVGALRDRGVLAGMWVTVLPGLLFGTIGVLAPLRLDELGAGAALIAGVFLVGAALESGVSPIVGRASDRRGRLVPALVGVAGSALFVALLPWPQTLWLLVLLVVVTEPVVGILWIPAMAMLADRAEARGLAQGYAFALSNLAWSVGQTSGAAGSARLADATSDAVPYLLVAGVCALTFLALRRGLAREGAAAAAAAALPATAA